jgi:prepilin-type N-terminal cleavage/methylation domain-containing protein
MSRLSLPRTARAFTLIELLLVIAIIAVLAALLMPVPGGRGRAWAIICRNNLKQQALRFRLWGGDHEGKFPWQVTATHGGTMELIPDNRVSPHFQALTNCGLELRILVCPSDKVRRAATPARSTDFTDQNVSYFLNLDTATNSPVSVLTGDRHLQSAGQPVQPGLFTWTTNLDIGWTRELHTSGKTAPAGNLLFTDDHVEWVRKDLTTVFRRQGVAASRLVVP